MENDLARLPVVILDCQTTGATPAKGSLLEIAWAILPPGITEREPEIHSFLVSLPEEETVPGRISRMTGISSVMPGDGIEKRELAKLLLPVFRNAVPVAHFAVFEQRWIDHLFSTYLPDEQISRILCTREIARRLYPNLPRKGIRAIAGYLGSSMDEKKRAAEHVRATSLIWASLVSELNGKGIMKLSQLNEFLLKPPSPRIGSWDYPLPKVTRLSLPDTPGVYRLLSKDGKVLYAGKTSSLKRRVNSYFTRRKADEKTLELVSGVHDVSIDECETPLEAALLEFETIRRFDPPYNIALRERGREVVFLSEDLSSCSTTPGGGFVWGPVPDNSPALLLSELRLWINEGSVPAELPGPVYLPLENGALESGLSMFRNELLPGSPVTVSDILSSGLAAWLRHIDEKSNEPDEDGEESSAQETIDAAGVMKHLEWLLASGVRDLRRGAWFCQLGWSSLLWKPAFSESSRCALFSAGRLISSTWMMEKELLSPEPVSRVEMEKELLSPEPVSRVDRQLQFDSELYDLLRVLDAEVRRITADDSLMGVQTSAGKVLKRGKLKDLYRLI